MQLVDRGPELVVSRVEFGELEQQPTEEQPYLSPLRPGEGAVREDLGQCVAHRELQVTERFGAVHGHRAELARQAGTFSVRQRRRGKQCVQHGHGGVVVAGLPREVGCRLGVPAPPLYIRGVLEVPAEPRDRWVGELFERPCRPVGKLTAPGGRYRFAHSGRVEDVPEGVLAGSCLKEETRRQRGGDSVPRGRPVHVGHGSERVGVRGLDQHRRGLQHVACAGIQPGDTFEDGVPHGRWHHQAPQRPPCPTALAAHDVASVPQQPDRLLDREGHSIGVLVQKLGEFSRNLFRAEHRHHELPGRLRVQRDEFGPHMPRSRAADGP